MWDKISEALRSEVSGEVFDRWFKAVEPVEITGQHLTLKVPNDIYRFWIEDNYIGSLRAAILLVVKGALDVRFVCDSTAAVPVPEVRREPVRVAETEQETEEKAVANGMNPRNTFETFVVGKNNDFAHAACLAVGKTPGKVYNPLFFYGGVGLGKTHLMHAIGQHVLTNRKGAKVAYVTREKFANEFIDGIQNGTLVKFRKRYRQVDVLLIDDIHFFAGKERSQEEFFHTFNALLEGGRQIILTCDRYPKEIEGLEERLKSRFGWGLPVCIEPPELETRVAILHKKAEEFGVNLPSEVGFFIAKRIRSNIRELEGSLRRVMATANFTGKPITLEFAKETLRDLIALQDKLVTIDNIQKTVAEYYKIRGSDLLSNRRSRSITRPRQLAMSLSKELTNHSLPEIGSAFGGRDHTTVLHACRKIVELRESDSRINEDYINLLRTLSN